MNSSVSETGDLAGQRLRESEAGLAAAQRLARMGSWELDLAHLDDVNRNPLQWSDEVFRIFGYEPGAIEVSNENFFRAVHPEDRERITAAVAESVRERRPYDLTHRIILPDGTERIVHERSNIHCDARTGKPLRMMGTVQDVTERQLAQDRTRESEERHRALVECSPDAILVHADGQVVYLNPAGLRLLGAARMEEVEGRPLKEFIHPDFHGAGPDRVRDDLGPVPNQPLPQKVTRLDGRTVEVEASSIRFSQGGRPAVLSIIRDVTARKRTEEALRESEERFRSLAERINQVFWFMELDPERVLYVSPVFEQIWGIPASELYLHPRKWEDAIHREDAPGVHEKFEQWVTGKTATFETEYRIVRPDGSVRWMRDRGVVSSHRNGRPHRLSGIAEDITERLRLEEQLRQSQKMESIGRLAGGVAHDFNNILTVIQGHASLMQARHGVPPEAVASVHEIAEAAERAANLTRQLLTFSRQQVMKPRQLNLNEVAGNMAKMLQRLVGEDVSFQLDLGSQDGLIEADSGMIEQVLMNLVVNARDAMPRGGRLKIRTDQVRVDRGDVPLHPEARPGQFVRLEVTDTGCGVPAGDLPHLFEPFFTTKEVGKGTGLGLATVYGIVKQHHGWITVDSRMGEGTRFQIFLPASERNEARPALREPVPAVQGGKETVLVVEDEGPLRNLVQHYLERLGYRIYSAPNGAAALEVWQIHRDEIQLVLTDMVMPGGISGRELTVRLLADKPAIRVIYTTGYSLDVFDKDLVLHEGVNFLQKPYPPQKLAQTLRACLDAK